MVDAAIGNKTGIDVEDIKNLAGTFSAPDAIFIYPGFLETLPEDQMRSGFAEILKHGLIAEESHWQAAIKGWQMGNLDEVIERSAAIKLKVVDADEREAGQRKILNFGHTLGHAVESFFLSRKTPILHGDAVAAGMLMESFISHKKAGLPDVQFEEIIREINAVFGHIEWSAEDDQAIADWLQYDKKNNQGANRYTLLRQIGQATYDVEVNLQESLEALRWYREMQR
jgi:3-dehydroquinate synthase